MSSRRASRLAVPAVLLSLLFGGVLGVACGGPPPGSSCRYDPLCGSGGLGASCNNNSDCFDGKCCEKDECDNGTCSLPCKKDKDCPAGLSCHGDWCYFRCDNNGDCAPGQFCKNDDYCSWD